MVKTTTNRHHNLEENPLTTQGQNAISASPDRGVALYCFPFKIEAIYGFNEQKPVSCDLGESDNNRRPQADLCFARLLGKSDHKKSEFSLKKSSDRDKILILNRTAPYLPGKWVVFGCQGGLWLERIVAISTDSITFASAPNIEVPTDRVEMIGVVAKVQHAGF